jgi:hypothetical protein
MEANLHGMGTRKVDGLMCALGADTGLSLNRDSGEEVRSLPQWRPSPRCARAANRTEQHHQAGRHPVDAHTAVTFVLTCCRVAYGGPHVSHRALSMLRDP